MKYLIHIGTLKTGSTTIQKFLDERRSDLIKQGVLFPKTGLILKTRSETARGSGHNDFVNAFSKQKIEIWEKLQIEASAYGEIHTVLLSAENFSIHPELALPLKNSLGMSSAKIIVYLRRQDTYLESLYGEYISGGWKRLTETPEEFFGKTGQHGRSVEQDYLKLLEPWSRAFSPENIIVRPFEKQQWKNQQLLEDFFDAAGLAWYEKFNHIARRDENVSLSPEMNEMIRRLNFLPIDKKHYQAALKKIFDELQLTHKPKKQYFSKPALRKQLLERVSTSNAAVARQYLNRVDGDLFYEKWPENNDPWEEIPLKDLQLFDQLAKAFLEQYEAQLFEQKSTVSADAAILQIEEIRRIIGGGSS